MKSPSIFKEYIWLVNTIYKNRKITLEEINKKWVQTDMSGGMPLARSTFNRHKDAIEDIFGIFINCERKGGYKYYIVNAEVLKENSIQNWMLSTLSVNNIICESRCVHNRIMIESIPSDGEYLHMVIEAMKENALINFTYQKYSSSSLKEAVAEPYMVKLFNRRWYMICRYVGTKELRIFSFDRIQSLEVTTTYFKMDEEFNANLFFDECFGIIKDDMVPLEHITIRAYDAGQYYLRDLPIHYSQKAVSKSDNYTDFEFRIRPTLDFLTYLLSLGNQIKVIKPQWVAEKVKNMHLEALKRYK